MDDINISLDELNTIDLSPLIQSKLPEPPRVSWRVFYL